MCWYICFVLYSSREISNIIFGNNNKVYAVFKSLKKKKKRLLGTNDYTNGTPNSTVIIVVSHLLQNIIYKSV